MYEYWTGKTSVIEEVLVSRILTTIIDSIADWQWNKRLHEEN